MVDGEFSLKDYSPSNHLSVPPVAGEVGTPRPYHVRHDDVVMLLLVACSVLLVVVIGRSMRTVKNHFNEFFFPSAADDNDVPSGVSPLLSFLSAMTCVMVALCSFIYSSSEQGGTFVVSSNLAVVAIFFALSVAYLLLKGAVYGMVNTVLFGGKKTLQWSGAFFFITALEGVLLFPLPWVMACFRISVQNGIYYFAFILFLCKTLTFYKGWSIFFRQKIFLLQFFLYFCALELAPLLAFGGVWLILAHFLKVNF